MADQWHPVEDKLSAWGPKPRLQACGNAPVGRLENPQRIGQGNRWIEKYLPIPIGHNQGQPMRLAGFQKQIIKTLYDSLATFVSIPAANGKSTLLAAAGIERLCRGDAYVEVDVLATKKEQAQIIVEAAKRFVQSVPDLADRCVWYAKPGILEFRPTGAGWQRTPLGSARCRASISRSQSSTKSALPTMR